jgi:hypothetical protein
MTSRQQRRAQARSQQKAARRHRKVAAVAALIDAAKARARADGQPFRLLGFVDACADCSATADITLHPDGRATSDVWHDDGCPAAAGTVPWSVAS